MGNGSNVYYLCGMMLPLVGKSLAVRKTAFAGDAASIFSACHGIRQVDGILDNT